MLPNIEPESPLLFLGPFFHQSLSVAVVEPGIVKVEMKSTFKFSAFS